MFAELLQQGGLSLDRLQSFCLVAEAGGVTKAAKGDPVRQSLFSRQIKELEEFFGVELVRRKGRGIALTAAGMRLHRLAREQLLALSDFKKAVAGEPVTLTLAAGDSLIQWLLLPRLEAIRAKLPGLTFRVLNLPTTEIATRLRDGTVDLALVRSGSVAPPLKTTALGTMNFSLFVPASMPPAAKSVFENGSAGRARLQPSLPDSNSNKGPDGSAGASPYQNWHFQTGPKGKPAPADAWHALPLATLEGSGQFRQELQRCAERRKLKLNFQLELSSFPLVAHAVESGRYAAILPSLAAVELARSWAVESRPDFLRPLSRKLVLAWNPRLARIRPGLYKAILVFSGSCRIESGDVASHKR